MRTWGRLNRSRFCGGCGRRLPEGALVLGILIAGLGRTLIRCDECEGPAPEVPDVPVLLTSQEQREAYPARMERLRSITVDFKQRASEREKQ